MSGFWTGGHDAFVKALQEEHDAKIEELRAQLQRADDADRKAIEDRIREAESELEAKIKDAAWLLF